MLNVLVWISLSLSLSPCFSSSFPSSISPLQSSSMASSPSLLLPFLLLHCLLSLTTGLRFDWMPTSLPLCSVDLSQSELRTLVPGFTSSLSSPSLLLSPMPSWLPLQHKLSPLRFMLLDTSMFKQLVKWSIVNWLGHRHYWECLNSAFYEWARPNPKSWNILKAWDCHWGWRDYNYAQYTRLTIEHKL